jgi:hypothetical protein
MAADPRNYPVLSATLIAPAVAWLIARYLPGVDLSDEQVNVIAGLVWAAGAFLATALVRSKRTLPDPKAVKAAPSAEALLAQRVRESQKAKAPPFDTP